MNCHDREIVVVEARATQVRVVKVEAERFDEVKRRPRHGGEPDGVAGVTGDERFKKHDVGHRFESLTSLILTRTSVGA